MFRRSFLGSVAGLVGARAAALAALPDRPADLIVRAKRVYTVDQRRPQTAFAIREGRFIDVGSVDRMMAHAGSKTRILDAGDHTIVPGIIDAHAHLLSVGLDLQQVNLFGSATFDEVVRRTMQWAASSNDPWIQGDGWDQNRWPDQQFPTHEKLSAAFPDRPVVLGRVDGHALVANARAMALAGVTNSTADPPGGHILRLPDGSPSGVFIDNAMHVIYRAIPPPTHEQVVRAVSSAIMECNRHGVIGIGDAYVDEVQLAAYEELAARHQYSLRNYMMLADVERLIDEHLRSGPVAAAHDGRFWIRAIKLYVDGALGSRGAALLEPYADDPGNTGLLRITGAHVQAVAEKALRNGFQVCTHAIGDRGNRIVLDAYEAALTKYPTSDHRFRVEHAQVLSPADIPRFAKLRVVPSMQTSHQTSDMPWAEHRLGPRRILDAYAWRSLLDTGVVIPNGTDAPVESIDPLISFHSAVSRQDGHNLPSGGWYPDQRMSREEALKSITLWAAYGNFQERVMGSIAPGKFADFVILDGDIMTAPVEEILSTKVAATYLGGEAAYERSQGEAYAPRRPGVRSRHGCCRLTTAV